MSSDTKKSAIRFNIVSLATPFQVRGLGDLVLSTRFTKDQDTIHRLAGAFGLNTEYVPEGIKLTSGPRATIEAHAGHWRIVDTYDGSVVAFVEFAIREENGWAVQFANLSDLALDRLSAIEGAEMTQAGSSLDDMIARGVASKIVEAFDDMLGSMFGMNGHDADLGEDYDVFARMRAQGVGIDFG